MTFLQISPKLMVSFANLQICEPYDLRYPISMVFALRSKMCTFLDLSAKIMEIGYLKSYGSHIWRFANETISYGLICKKTAFVLQ